MKIAILYICTGNYNIFWENFYKSSEQYFLTQHAKEYFVFTDKDIFPVNERIHLIHQEKLGWPFDTLMRFKMFSSIKDNLQNFDYIFFLNANMLFLKPIHDDILPNSKEKLLMLNHPGFFNKNREEYTYDRNPESIAYIHKDQGEYYFMGSFNGGCKDAYLDLICELEKNVDIDLKKEIIALWHDESHLNKYMLNRNAKILSPAYGYPEGWNLPFEQKIVILDKSKLGGHDYLRGNQIPKKKISIRKFLSKLSRFLNK
jgi:hypothetical protein